jgi:hypothetical protein
MQTAASSRREAARASDFIEFSWAGVERSGSPRGCACRAQPPTGDRADAPIAVRDKNGELATRHSTIAAWPRKDMILYMRTERTGLRRAAWIGAVLVGVLGGWWWLADHGPSPVEPGGPVAQAPAPAAPRPQTSANELATVPLPAPAAAEPSMPPVALSAPAVALPPAAVDAAATVPIPAPAEAVLPSMSKPGESEPEG